jgi:DMSO reductase iron-sulfur subunit
MTEAGLQPLIPLEPGEQYRFHFDMTKCVGCKCCEVACHEQNNNPAAVKWRQVGEIEGGEFPQTARLYVSMACNHCLEPSCLEGCPTDTYYKDPTTGAVRMREDSCIGCGYCTWNCPYDAPQFNPERNIVTKCDFCHNRLMDGDLPACVAACPSGALEIETVNPENWKTNHSEGNAPSVPESSITLSTTRFTVPKNLKADLNRTDEYRLKPERPHYSLVFMTVLTQLSVGGFLSLFLSEILSHFGHLSPLLQKFLQVGPLAMLGTSFLAIGTSVFHLGRPLFAFRALKMWRRSWLSREVLFFTLFSGLAALYSLLRWKGIVLPMGVMIGLGSLVAITGIGGIYSSARIYMVPARPSWNNIRTPIAFFSTSFLLGPLLTLLLFAWQSRVTSIPLLENGGALIGKGLVGIILVAGLFQLGSILVKLFYILSREEHELRGTAKLLTQWFRYPFLSRIGSLLLTLLGVPLALLGLLQNGSATVFWIGALLALGLGSEILGRYLFFVSVVPKNRPEGYF